MNRHHQSPSFIEGYSQDVTEVSGGHEGIKKIIQSWGANCTLKLETTMVTTMDPNDKFTKPHDIPMIFLWRFTNISWKFSWTLHRSSIFLWYSYGIPMIFPWILPRSSKPHQIHGLLVQRLHGCAHVVAQGGHQELVLIAAIGRLFTPKNRKGCRWGGKNRTNHGFSWMFYQKWWGNHKFF